MIFKKYILFLIKDIFQYFKQKAIIIVPFKLHVWKILTK